MKENKDLGVGWGLKVKELMQKRNKSVKQKKEKLQGFKDRHFNVPMLAA